MANRRSVLIGLGSLVAGGGALLGTGAFTTVTAEREVNVSTEGDASAFLQLVPAGDDDDNGEYASQSDGTITITLNGSADTEGGSGLNQNARTTIDDIVQVTNNGTNPITDLNLTMTADDSQLAAISFTSDTDADGPFNHGENILNDNLGTGSSVEFGIIVDLIDNSLPDSSPYDLTIEAQTAQSQSN